MESNQSPCSDFIIVPAVKLESSGSYQAPVESKKCVSCLKSYKLCECKSCAKCGSTFLRHITGAVKGRSHCRTCGEAVCLVCHALVGGIKVCTRCHLKQKEEEISTEKALSAIEQAKYGEKKVDAPSYAKLKFGDKRKDALFEAAKKGDDHIMITILSMGLDVNSKDGEDNTAVFYAAEGGHLTCVALLLEKGANVRIVNKSCWTPLHAVAWKGSTDAHVECAKMLLEMGADALAESETNETAADVAERCNGKKEIIQLLRFAEVDMAVKELREKMDCLLACGLKERRFCRILTSVINYVNSVQLNGDPAVTSAAKLLLPPENLVKSASFDKTLAKRNSCPQCGGCSSTASAKRFGGSLEIIRPKADVEPIVRDNAVGLTQDDSSGRLEDRSDHSLPIQAKLLKCEAERKEWEARSRKLMQSMAFASKESKKKIDDLESQIQLLQDEKENEIKKIEAAYANKLAKVRRDADASVRETQAQLAESEEERKDVIQLQAKFRLTWVPDALVRTCQNPRCRAPFTATTRKHHCRCCGRVFCATCSPIKSELTIFGYSNPVRMCSTCFALVDDYLADRPETKPDNCSI